MKSEFELIQYLKSSLPRASAGQLGIGDDAALLSIDKKSQLAVSSDVIVEGVDFKSGQVSARKIGRKALAINLSDLAAMGAKPKAYFVSLGLSSKQNEKWVKEFYEGMKPLSKKYKCACLGGDLSSSKTLFASVTILGEVWGDRTLRRDKATPGDLIAITGRLGGSILAHHFDFEPRIREGQYLGAKKYIRAGIDISDGLVQDLEHLLKSSKVGAKLFLDQIPISNDAKRRAKQNSEKALSYALSDGEDFELLFTAPRAKQKHFEAGWKKKFPRVKLSWIGEVITKPQRLEFYRQNNKVKPFKTSGFDHFK